MSVTQEEYAVIEAAREMTTHAECFGYDADMCFGMTELKRAFDELAHAEPTLPVAGDDTLTDIEGRIGDLEYEVRKLKSDKSEQGHKHAVVTHVEHFSDADIKELTQRISRELALSLSNVGVKV